MQQTKAIMEELARARNHYHRHDVMRAMLSVATALKATITQQIVGRDKALVDNGILEIVQLLNRTQEVKRHCPTSDGLVMDKANHKPLFQALLNIIKKVKEEAEKESLEQIRQRKLELDNHLIRGCRYLENKNLKDAEEAFQECLKNYVDEHKVFYIMGNKLLDTGFPRPALKYLLKGLEKDEDTLPVAIAAAKAYAALDENAKAETLLTQHLEKSGETRDPDLFALLAQVQVKQGKAEEALRSAAQGLKADPGHKGSRMLYNKLRKARGKKQAAK